MISFKMRTAIIVLNYNNYKITCTNVQRLIELDGDYFIVIVDNNSKDDSINYIKRSFEDTRGILIVESKVNGGYSFGNNLGAKEAIKINPKLEFIAVMNPDVIIQNPQIFTSMLDRANKNEKIAVIAPRMIENNIVQTNRSGWMIGGIWKKIFARTAIENIICQIKEQPISKGNYQFVDAVHGSFFVIKRTIFEHIGFFDAQIFLYGEETVLGIKIKKAGYLECIDEDYTFIHDHDYSKETVDKMICQGKQMFNSSKYILKKYYNANWYHRFLYTLIQGSLYYIYYPLLFKIKEILKTIFRRY